MADRYAPGEEMETEVQETLVISEEEALYHFGRYTESRAALPWDQRTFKEKFMHRLDQIFLIFLVVVFVAVLSEAAYKFWYVISWRKIMEYAQYMISYFITQESEEELLEL